MLEVKFLLFNVLLIDIFFTITKKILFIPFKLHCIHNSRYIEVEIHVKLLKTKRKFSGPEHLL